MLHPITYKPIFFLVDMPRKKSIVPRTINTDGIENHFSCSSQQNGRSGDVPTAQEQQTNDTRASTFIVTAGPSKGNNTSAPKIFEKKKKN